jgi:hypothetical protein
MKEETVLGLSHAGFGLRVDRTAVSVGAAENQVWCKESSLVGAPL